MRTLIRQAAGFFKLSESRKAELLEISAQLSNIHRDTVAIKTRFLQSGHDPVSERLDLQAAVSRLDYKVSAIFIKNRADGIDLWQEWKAEI